MLWFGPYFRRRDTGGIPSFFRRIFTASLVFPNFRATSESGALPSKATSFLVQACWLDRLGSILMPKLRRF